MFETLTAFPVEEQPRIFVLDDDLTVLRALDRVFRTAGLPVETFDKPAAFLKSADYAGPCCLVLDLMLPGTTGLQIQRAMRESGNEMPIVFLSGRSDVQSATQAMREGAVDFLVKPVEDERLVNAVRDALARSAAIRRHSLEHQAAQKRLARLTRRELQVCQLVARGLPNKQIALELGLSEKTVKFHRGRVMHKLEVDSVVALVRLLQS